MFRGAATRSAAVPGATRGTPSSGVSPSPRPQVAASQSGAQEDQEAAGHVDQGRSVEEDSGEAPVTRGMSWIYCIITVNP